MIPNKVNPDHEMKSGYTIINENNSFLSKKNYNLFYSATKNKEKKSLIVKITRKKSNLQIFVFS